MADDPNKRHVDSWFVSSQQHEYDYFRRTMAEEFPGASEAALNDAILSCRKQLAPSEGREKLKACVRQKLKR
jgi:hypothetical protein